VIALLLMIGLLGPRRARAQDYGYYDDQGGGLPADYQDQLTPYGTWIGSDTYGDVWQPDAPIGWQPYVDGYWSWTPYGWTWVSDEPWGWTFHYGRWVSLPGGWAWVPGSQWGPAWVDWFSGDGFVGWAPLAPFGTVVVIQNFVFVHDCDFTARNLHHVVVGHHFLPDHVVRRWDHHQANHDRPPPVDHIQRVSHHGMARFDRRPPGTSAPRRAAGTQIASTPAAYGQAHRLGRAFGAAPIGPGVATLGRAWQPARPAPVVSSTRLGSPLPSAPVAVYRRAPAAGVTVPRPPRPMILGHAVPPPVLPGAIGRGGARPAGTPGGTMHRGAGRGGMGHEGAGGGGAASR
jgi:uncharacterized protein DUF6600